MKILTPSPNSLSLSPSSSSTLSFEPTLCNSKSAGCLSAIFHRILCSGGLPTHPSDQIRELDSIVNSVKVEEIKHKTESTSTSATTSISTPGIVARLMGLESNLEIPSKETQSSLSHSRSMNSLDYLGECKPMHRRVKPSSSSSHEAPTTFHLIENENFLVLSFERECEEKEFKSKGRKKKKRDKVHEEEEKVLAEKSKRVCDVSSSNVGDGGEVQSIGNTLSIVCSEKECIDSEALKLSQNTKLDEGVVTNGEKGKRRRKKRTACCIEKKVETECSSEDSSPVSVFDFERDALETEAASFGVGLDWRRKLSPELEIEHLVLHSDGNLMVEERRVNKASENNKHESSKKEENQSQDYADTWGEICRLVEEDLVGSNQKQGGFDSICEDFESQIFEHLLNDMIDQLCLGIPSTHICNF